MYGTTSIRAQELSLRQLLEGYKVYQVPLFQRPYSWGKRNWETLWDDLVDTYETNKASTSSTYRHFLGPILTVAHPATPEGISFYTIVDGQQRLVTIALLLAAIKIKVLSAIQVKAESCTKSSRLSTLAEQLQDILIHRYAPRDLKIQPTHTDRATFDAIIRSGVSEAATRTQVVNAYDFFQKKLNGWLNSHTFSDLLILAAALLDQTVVVHITLGEKDSAYRIFESLNYKGVPLTVVDLVRNYLFMQVSADSASEIHREIWGPIEERYRESFPPGAKNGTRHLIKMSEAVWHYVRMSGREIRKLDAYPALVDLHETWLKNRNSSRGFIEDLAESLTDYLYFLVPEREDNKALSERFEALIELNFGAVAPLVLMLKKRVRQGKLTKSAAADLLQVLEAYYIHRLLAGLPSNSLGRLVLEVLRVGILDEEQPVTALKNFLKARTQETRWPSKGEVENGLLKQNLETYAPYLLRRLEKHLWRTTRRKEIPELKNLTLEHIMPRVLDEKWRSELGRESRTVHHQYLHTLPNLTLTGYNPEMGNKPYSAKRDYLREKSDLSLNQEYFCKEDAPKQWDENALKDRAKWLFDIILQVWPMP